MKIATFSGYAFRVTGCVFLCCLIYHIKLRGGSAPVTLKTNTHHYLDTDAPSRDPQETLRVFVLMNMKLYLQSRRQVQF